MRFRIVCVLIITVLISCGYERQKQRIHEFSVDETREGSASFLLEEIEDEPDDEMLHYWLAQTYYKQALYSESLESVNKAILLNENNGDFLLLKAKVLADIGESDKALITAKQCETFTKSSVSLYVLLVELCLAIDDHVMADQYLKRLRYLDPNHLQLNYLTGMNYYYIADTTEAVLYLEKAIVDLPNQVEIYALLTQISIAQNDLEKAGLYLNKGLEHNKTAISLSLVLSDLKGKQGDKDEQKRLLQHLYLEDSSLYSVKFKLADYYYSDKEYDSTLFYLSKIEEFNRLDLYKGNRLKGDAFLKKSKLDSAEVYFKKCLEVESLDSYAQKQLRVIRVRRRNKNKPRESSSDNIRNFVEIKSDSTKSDKKLIENQPEKEEKGLFDIW